MYVLCRAAVQSEVLLCGDGGAASADWVHQRETERERETQITHKWHPGKLDMVAVFRNNHHGTSVLIFVLQFSLLSIRCCYDNISHGNGSCPGLLINDTEQNGQTD